jgi:hypothetical protein
MRKCARKLRKFFFIILLTALVFLSCKDPGDDSFDASGRYVGTVRGGFTNLESSFVIEISQEGEVVRGGVSFFSD